MPKNGRLLLSGQLDLAHIGPADVTLACDAAALAAVQAGLDLDVAVGDFDSVTAEELSIIAQAAQNLVTLPVAKDDTDAQAAVLWFFQHYPTGQLTIYGAFGGRLDHALANIFLPSHPEIAPFMEQIVLRDAWQELTYVPQGRHIVQQTPGMTGLAFVQEGQGQLGISGARFDLTGDNYFQRKVYSSNNFLTGPVTVTVPDGYVICLQTRERRRQ